HRNIPRALIGGTLIIMALYVFVNASYFWVLAPENVASISTSSSVAFESARRFLGPAALGVMAAGLMISTFGALHTNVLAGSRVTYAVASDGLFPRLLGSVHSGTRVPAARVLLRGAWRLSRRLGGLSGPVGLVRRRDDLRDFRVVDLLRSGGRSRVRTPMEAARCRAAVPHLGLSVRSAALPCAHDLPARHDDRRDA